MESYFKLFYTIFHSLFLLWTTIRPKVKVLIDLFLLFRHDHFIQICGPLSFIYSYFLYLTLRPNIRFLIDLFPLFAHNHWTKIFYSFSFILSFYTSIQPKLKVLIDLFLLFAHNHSTKFRGHSYSLIFSFLNYANISFAIIIVALPLYFVNYIHVSHVLIFCMLYSWQAFIQALLSTAIFSHRLSFFTVYLVRWLCGVTPWYLPK